MLMKMTMRNEVSHTIIAVVIIFIIIIRKTLPVPRPPKPRPALLGEGISQDPRVCSNRYIQNQIIFLTLHS